MGTNPLHALRHAFSFANELAHPRLYRSALRLQHARAAPYVTISDPSDQPNSTSISLAHPKDPSQQSGSCQSSPVFPPPPPPDLQPQPASATGSTDTCCTNDKLNNSSSSDSNVPAKYVHPPIDPHMHLSLPHAPPPHVNPPFNTHRFFLQLLEGSFPYPTARNLMRATRALLVDRIGRVKRDALTTQDLESQAYLFQAALSKLRTEASVLTRNETAAMRTATTALRREADALDTRMKEDTGTLKHEIQLDVDSRKNEVKGELKRLDLHIEEVLSRALITIGELKTQVEESRWEKLKAAVGALGVLSLVIMVSMEIYVVEPNAKKRSSPRPAPTPEVMPPNGGPQPWVT